MRDSLMAIDSKELLSTPLKWRISPDPLYPYTTFYEGARLRLRLNNFPDDKMYSLIKEDGEVLTTFDDWPLEWKRPSLWKEMVAIAVGFVRIFFQRLKQKS